MERTNGLLELDGARLYYETAGRGDPIVFIHGHTLDGRMWDDQFDVFARTHRAIRYDMRGFGRSSLATSEPYAPTDDLAQLLAHLEVERAHIVGLSLGGERAIDFAIACPQTTRSLVAVAAGLGGYAWRELRVIARAVQAAASTGGAEAAREIWLASALFAPALEQRRVAARLTEILDGYSGWHWTGGRERLVRSDPPAIDRLDRVACPMLAIVGERDLSDFREIADLLCDRVPGGTLEVMSGVGHLPNMEAPERFNALLADFVARR